MLIYSSTPSDKYIRICTLYDDSYTGSKSDYESNQPSLSINDSGLVNINGKLTIRPHRFDKRYFKLLNYLCNYETTTNDDVCLVIELRNNGYYEGTQIRIELYIQKSCILKLTGGQPMPPLFWITDAFDDLFVSGQYRPYGLFSQDKIATAKIAPNEVIDMDYQKYLKLPLYPHQLNNVEWMSTLEHNISHIDENYLYVNMANFLKCNQGDDLQDIYFHKYTNKLYDSNLIFDQFNPIYKLKLVGGVLCDEVGVGKTASIIGLIIKQKFARTTPKKILNTTASTLKKKTIKPKIMLKRKDAPIESSVSTQNEKNDNSQQQQLSQVALTDYLKNINKYHPYYSYPASRATLIVCPRRLAFQWRDEFDKFCGVDLNICMLTTLTDFKKYDLSVFLSADVVIISTSFMTNKNYLDKIEEEGCVDLSKIYWDRIIVDEFHEILDRTSRRKAEQSLYSTILKYKGKYKWCLSATPLPHDHNSFESLMIFLSNQEETLCQFKEEENDGHNNLIVDNLTVNIIEDIYNQYFRHNTKESIKKIALIPDYKMMNQLLQFTDIEKAIYNQAAFSDNKERLVQICTNILVSDEDSAMIGNQVLSLTEINKLMIKYYENEKKKMLESIANYRQKEIIDTADYKVELEATSSVDEKKRVTNNYRAKIKRINDNVSSLETEIKKTEQTILQFTSLNIDQFKHETCQICGQLFKEVAIQPNGHYFCSDCINLLLQSNKNEYECPLTNQIINKNQIKVMANKYHPEYDKGNYVNEAEVNKWGTKMTSLINYIQKAIENDPTDKIIVFSQWDKMLKLVGDVLTYNKIGHVFCRGNVHQIAKSIREFKTNPQCKVVLLSAERSSSGNNLTEANHIILLDTINHDDWETIERQAIGRCVRLGQRKSCVYVVRMIIKNTIEEENYNRHFRNI